MYIVCPQRVGRRCFWGDGGGGGRWGGKYALLDHQLSAQDRDPSYQHTALDCTTKERTTMYSSVRCVIVSTVLLMVKHL